MRRYLSMISVLALMFFTLTLFPRVVSAGGYRSWLGSCKKAFGRAAQLRAPHLFFTTEGARVMGAEREVLKSENRKVKLFNTKLELKDDEIRLWVLQYKASEKAVGSLTRKAKALNLLIIDIKKDNKVLDLKNRALSVQISTYKGERYQYLVWGFVGGFALAALAGGAVGLAFALK